MERERGDRPRGSRVRRPFCLLFVSPLLFHPHTDSLSQTLEIPRPFSRGSRLGRVSFSSFLFTYCSHVFLRFFFRSPVVVLLILRLQYADLSAFLFLVAFFLRFAALGEILFLFITAIQVTRRNLRPNYGPRHYRSLSSALSPSSLLLALPLTASSLFP